MTQLTDLERAALRHDLKNIHNAAKGFLRGAELRGELEQAAERLHAFLSESAAGPEVIRRLNPYLSDGLDESQGPPPDPVGKFIWGVRYYLGMLERQSELRHAVGHIQALCHTVLREGLDP